MNKNIEKGKESEAKVLKFIKKSGPSRLREIGSECGASPGQEISWAFSVCKRLVAQGFLVKNKKEKTIFYDLPVRDGNDSMVSDG